MNRFKAVLFVFLLAGMLVWCQDVLAAGTPVTTVSSLMKVLQEDKQKAVYNMQLNAPFSKENSGIRESVNTETGEVIVTNTVFEIPGRNGNDLSLALEYRSRDAKAYNEGTRSGGVTNSYGVTL